MTNGVANEAALAEARAGVPGSRSILRNVDEQGHARFELYQSPMSLCSQKVRAVLAHKNAPYLSHDLRLICYRDSEGVLQPADNYHPGYVKLRLLGQRDLTVDLARSWTGRTSVATEGFDPCVVPTLVDLASGLVVVDSARILKYIDEQYVEAPRLIPPDPALASAVLRQVSIVDRTPHGALLAGFHPDDDRRPEPLKQIMLHYHVDKIETLHRLVEQNRDHAQLRSAYEAKIQKEDVGEAVCHDAVLMRAARADTRGILETLEGDLAGPDWLCGRAITMADLAWGVSLFRIKYLGLEKLWSDLPKVSDYWSRVSQIPAIREEVIGATISSLPPSEYV